MSYISLSDKDKKKMMDRIGVSSYEDLFKTIPKEIKIKDDLKIPSSMTEPELINYFEKIAQKNKNWEYQSFIGAGSYNHIIPSIVDYLSSRGELVTPYTPYQPEVSQGTLQIIFEFQTLISQLTGMDISNASLYDGASGAAEAVLMANRIIKRPKVLIGGTVHPQYRRVIQTYVKNIGIDVIEIGYLDSGTIDIESMKKKIDDQTTAVVCQYPNFMGIIEDLAQISEIVHSTEALLIVLIGDAVSLGILESPGNFGADIVAGEGQSFGIPMSFGGPYLGFIACREKFLRQFPGRISGLTKDIEGKRGFVLTLSTREQHIRRERATSNICTNQALCALRASIFLESMGQEGLKELAWQNIQKSHYALDKLCAIKGIRQRFKGEFFNEFVIELTKKWKEIEDNLIENKILAGLSLQPYYKELDNCVLVCVTEVCQKEEIDFFVETLEQIL